MPPTIRFNTPGLFVTGTDTEVGKTHIGCALVRQLRMNGVRVRAVKPAESGHIGMPTASEDGGRLALAAGQKEPAHALQRLQMAVAPPVAADAEGVELQFEAWMEACEELADECEVLGVEGAGGLMSPLTWEHSALDVAERLGAALMLARQPLWQRGREIPVDIGVWAINRQNKTLNAKDRHFPVTEIVAVFG